MRTNVYFIFLLLSITLIAREYSSIKTRESEVVFYRIMKEKTPLYNTAANTSNVKFFFSKGEFVQHLGAYNKFLNVAYKDLNGSIVKGWIRSNSVYLQKYYSYPLMGTLDSSKVTALNKKMYKPMWLKEKVFFFKDSLGKEKYSFSFDQGKILKTYGEVNNFVKIKLPRNNQEVIGFTPKEFLSETISARGLTKPDSLLFKTISPALLTMGIEKNGYLAYSCLKDKDGIVSRYSEEIKCLPEKPDSIIYKLSNSLDKVNIDKKLITKRSKNVYNRIDSYRFLPDEDIKTRDDVAKCKVIEVVYKPKIAKVKINSFREEKITNEIEKIYILPLKSKNTELVFRRIISKYEYFLSESKKKKEEEVITTKILKNAVRFNFY